MLLTSVPFLFFFILTTVLYYALPRRLQRAVLLVASCAFYASFVPSYAMVFLGLIVLNFFLVPVMESLRDFWRRAFFVFGIVANIGVLAVFKFAGFLSVETHALAQALGWNYSPAILSLVLPLGLSYLVFKCVSYCVEVYRGTIVSERDFVVFALYGLFFPYVLAGPIERPNRMLPQLRQVHAFDAVRVRQGIERILWGLFKKLVIADNIALLVSHVYGSAGQADATALLLLALLYPYQMYCDFSAYSDIAIGMARVFGIDLVENFDRPFASRSIAEYWRRWHLSLSNWFRDYLYFPLAFSGNKKSLWRRYVGLFVVFVVSGLWHGATGPFLAFGVFNGAVRVLDTMTTHTRSVLWKYVDRISSSLSGALQIAGTYVITMISLVFFSAPTVAVATDVLAAMMGGVIGVFDVSRMSTLFARGEYGISFELLWCILGAIVLVEFVQYAAARGRTLEDFSRLTRVLAYTGLSMAIIVFGNLYPLPFIYMQF